VLARLAALADRRHHLPQFLGSVQPLSLRIVALGPGQQLGVDADGALLCRSVGKKLEEDCALPVDHLLLALRRLRLLLSR
jgi:hypothetical protein